MLIRRFKADPWHEPQVSPYEDEGELERLLRESPSLLPGVPAKAGVVSRLEVPDTGIADLVIISADGATTMVECKLKANPEIRRRVVGQLFAYATGLCHLTYDQLDALFARRAGKSIRDAAETRWRREQHVLERLQSMQKGATLVFGRVLLPAVSVNFDWRACSVLDSMIGQRATSSWPFL